MSIATWTHGGSPLYTDIGTPPAGVGCSEAGTSTPSLTAACATWSGTGNENGDTGTVSITSDGGSPFFANITIIVQLFDDGLIDHAATLNTFRIAFDWDITSGPMGTATALSDLSMSGSFVVQTTGPGITSGTFDDTVTGGDLGFATMGDMFAAYGIGGFDGAAVTCTFYYTAGTFSVHDRRLAVSNFTVVANYGSAAPVVTDVAPTHGDAAGGTVVTLTGTGFTGATTASFNGSDTLFSPSSDTSGTCVTPAHAVGVVTVTVS